MRMNKDLMMSSLWKLKVVEIEMTLLHVCEIVCILRYLITYGALRKQCQERGSKGPSNGLENSRENSSGIRRHYLGQSQGRQGHQNEQFLIMTAV